MQPKPRRKLILGLAGAVAAIALLIFGSRWHSQRKLAAYKAALAAKGERISYPDLLLSAAGKEENAALQLIGAANRLGGMKLAQGNFPATMTVVAPGRARIGWQQNEIIGGAPNATNTWDDLAADLALMDADFQQMHAALQLPRLDFGLNYQQGFSMMLPHLQTLKRVGNWEAAAAMNHLHAGRLDAALTNLHDIIALSRLQAEEPLLISQLVRIAVASFGLNATWEALQAPGWDEARLARLQAAWQSQEFLPGVVRSMEMERAMVIVEIDRWRHKPGMLMQMGVSTAGPGPSNTRRTTMVEEAQYWFEQGMSGFYDTIWRWLWSYADEQQYLELMQMNIESGRAASQRKSAKQIRRDTRLIEERIENISPVDAVRFPVTRQVLPALFNAFNKAMRLQAQRDLTVTAIALKRFELRHGKLPASLEALVPEFLPALPIDFMDGQPLRYRLNADGSFLLYSVGDNFLDDGGNGEMQKEHRNATYLWYGRDAVWPAPASAEEIDAFQSKSRKKP
jgi:hypothetical protein